jgi:hypothetical protein
MERSTLFSYRFLMERSTFMVDRDDRGDAGRQDRGSRQ